MTRIDCVNKDVFEYTDYREFLRDRYKSLKRENARAFSFRLFSKRCGFNSPNFLKLVMDGKRNLSEDSAERFARGFKFSRDEMNFFKSLVRFNQATVQEDKEKLAKQLFRSGRFKKARPISAAQFDYYNKWYFVPIREMVSSKSFKEDPKWIANKLKPQIEPSEAEHAIKSLLQLGLLKRDSLGKLVQADAVLDTGDEVTAASVATFHREMLRKASESIDLFDRTEREISCVTIAISKENSVRIKNLIQNFRKQILQIADEQQDAEKICQIGLQLFPLSEDLYAGDKE